MGRKYAAYGTATNTASTTVPMWVLTGATTTRVRLYDINSWSNTAPADNSGEFGVRRTSARGTQSTTVTPNALDPADPASLVTYDTAWSVNPTVTASSDLLRFAHNLRATFRWVAIPGGELVIPATSGAGLALLAVVTNTASTYGWTVHWEE